MHEIFRSLGFEVFGGDDLIGESNVKFGGTAWVESISVISYFKPDVPYIVLHGQQVNGPRLDYGIIRKDYF